MTEYEKLFEQANAILADIGKLNGAEITLDVTGLSFIQVENKYKVTLQLTESGSFLKFVAYIGSHRSQGEAQILEYLLSCNYEADFLKSCSIGLCTQSRRFTLSFMCPLRGVDAAFVNNCILNFGVALKNIDMELTEALRKNHRAKVERNKGIPSRFIGLGEG